VVNDVFGSTKVSPESLSALLSRLPCILYRCLNDMHWTMTYLSDGCRNLTGHTAEALLHNQQLSFNDLIHPDDREWTFAAVERALAQKKAFTHQYRIITASGEEKWVWEQGVGVWDESGQLQYLEGFITDVTEQKHERDALKNSLGERNKELLLNVTLLNEYRKAVDEGAIVSKTDNQGVITYANKLFCDISGYTLNELIGRKHSLLRHSDMPTELFTQMWQTITSKQVWKGVIKNRNKQGEAYYVQSTIVPILKPDGSIYEFMSIRHDITDLIRQTRQIQRQTTDHLTQLPNRQKLIEDLQTDNGWKLAVFNIERFSEVNEYYGLDVGDALLQKTADLMSKFGHQLRLKLYKLSGDEFAFLCDERMDSEDFISSCRKALDMLETTNIEVDGNSFNLSMVVGISEQRNYYINAEIAMNHARNNHKRLVCFDNQVEIKDQLEKNVCWTRVLKAALRDDRLVVYAQPVISNKGEEQFKKYECLVRLINESGEVLMPGAFLEVAKKSRLYTEITRRVINQAFEFFADRPRDIFSINLTLEDILDSSVMQLLQDKVEHNHMGGRLILEIVESEGIENYEQVSRFIAMMQKLGCKVAIDDFGTGYSNFDYLMRLNVDIIKIDGSIIRNVDQDRNAQVVADLVVNFAQRLGIKTVAEFVHSEAVYKKVVDMHIDYSQGYYLAEPVPLSEI